MNRVLDFSFDHIAIAVTNVDASIKFYQNVLQLKEIPNTASNSKTRWLALNSGNQLHLIYRTDFKIKVNKAIHFALSTVDIDTFIIHLKRLDIEYSDWRNTPEKRYVRHDGIKQVYFQDPDGYWIEINNSV